MVSSAASPQPHTFVLTTRVYFQDTDAGGIVYHARFLDFFERARMDWLRALDMPVSRLAAETGVLFIVRSLEVDYLAPGRLDDELQIAVDLTEIRGARLLLAQSATRGEERLVEARVQLACVGRDTLHPTRIPTTLRSRLSAAAPSHGA